mmetsp:Transcript_6910/g.28123  ORF Transcript_6910/g.28123 Transcript_6910/m.28123 type:complete len:377 (-) Transcript_6910:1626-2756(-)
MVAPSDMDDETEALIRQLQQQDAAEYNRSRGLGRRERKAPEVYVPPPPGVGTLAKSDRPPESAKKDEGRRETRGRDQRDTRASTPAKSGGSTKSATQSAEKPAGGRASKSAEAPQSGGRSSRSRDASASTKPPLEGYVLHQEDIWKKVTPRPGGGDHCDIIYKRFDPATREEQPFHDCNRVGEYAKGENMKSLRSVTAVNRYLERRNKQKAKADRKAAAAAAAAGEAGAEDAAGEAAGRVASLAGGAARRADTPRDSSSALRLAAAEAGAAGADAGAAFRPSSTPGLTPRRPGTTSRAVPRLARPCTACTIPRSRLAAGARYRRVPRRSRSSPRCASKSSTTSPSRTCARTCSSGSAWTRRVGSPCPSSRVSTGSG